MLTEPTDTLPGVATRVWTWKADPYTYCVVMGSIDVQDDAVLASWGDVGDVRILSPGGDVLAHYGPRTPALAGYTSFLTPP